MEDSGDVIRYDINTASVFTSAKARWIAIAAEVLWTISLVVRHAPVVAYIVPVLGLVLLVTTSRGYQIIVDSKRVKLPLRKPLPWSEVEYVENPGRWSEAVTLHLTDGTSRPIGLPLQYAEDVARIGKVPIGPES